MHAIRADLQGVTAVGQRPADEFRASEGEHGHGLAADEGNIHLRIDQAPILAMQFDRPGVEEQCAAKRDGYAVDHGALGRSVVEDNALHLPRRSGQCVVDSLVQGARAIAAIQPSVGLQDISRGTVGQHFDRPSNKGWTAYCSRREGIIPVREPFSAPHAVGIGPHVRIEDQGCRHGLLVERPHLSATVSGRITGTAGVPVVEEDQGCGVEIVGVVLVGEPRVRVRGVDGKIAALSQPPDDVAVPRAVAVIDFDPVLDIDQGLNIAHQMFGRAVHRGYQVHLAQFVNIVKDHACGIDALNLIHGLFQVRNGRHHHGGRSIVTQWEPPGQM